MTRLRAASATDPGRVRTMNQDLAVATEELIAVADGVGGNAGGEVAARVAMDVFTASFSPHNGREGLVSAVNGANRAVYNEAEANTALRGMSTTLTSAAIVDTEVGQQIAVTNVGDSRGYLYENDRLRRLTDDHSLVEQLVRAGNLTPEEAAVHPHRNIITRALGIDPAVDVDSWVLEPRAGMRLLICSDGLTNECDDDEIAEVLRTEESPDAVVATLVERALEHGGNDNVTVVVADVIDVPEAPPAPPAEPARASERGATRRPPRPPAEPATGAAETIPLAKVSDVEPPRQSERLVTPRVVLFILVLVAILGGIAGFTVWFDRATYYVGIDNGQVAIFEGRPGGMLWFHPTLLTRTSVPVTSVLSANLPLLQQGVLESSYDDARQVVTNLESEKSLLGVPTTTFPPTTTIAFTATSVATTTSAATTTTVAYTTTTKAPTHRRRRR